MTCTLTRHALDHHGDGHSGGEAVRVEDDVGDEAGLGPGQVLHRPLPAADALLAGARRELVPDRRVARDPETDADPSLLRRAGLVAEDLDRVDEAELLALELLDEEGLGVQFNR